MNIDTPKRSFDPVYVKEPLVSDDIDKIRDHYGLQLQCKGKVFQLKIFSERCPFIETLENTYS